MNMRIVPIALAAIGMTGCSEAPAPQPPSFVASSPYPAPAWRRAEHTDAFTDVQWLIMSNTSTTSEMTMRIRCASSVPWVTISFFDQSMWPSADRNYYVDTRFDSSPAKTGQRWSGVRESVDIPMGQTDEFLQELALNERLQMRAMSTVMDKSSTGTFELRGAAEALESFERDCAAIQPLPDPVADP